MAYCRVLLCNINKKSSCCNGGFLFISNKHLVTFHFPLAIYQVFLFFCKLSFSNRFVEKISCPETKTPLCHQRLLSVKKHSMI